jgi:hypothetical protein
MKLKHSKSGTLDFWYWDEYIWGWFPTNREFMIPRAGLGEIKKANLEYVHRLIEVIFIAQVFTKD